MKFITITGPDACGKDTQIEKLSSYLKGLGLKVQKLSIQDSLQDFVEIADIKTINDVLNVFLLKVDPQARSFFLMSLLKNSYSKINSNADIVIYNGYWYKYASSEMAYGVPENIWGQNVNSFPVPDLIVEIQATFDNCLLRRSQWSPYESGQGRPHLEFHDFQKKMRASLTHWLKNAKTKKAVVNGDQDEETVASEIVKIATPLLQLK